MRTRFNITKSSGIYQIKSIRTGELYIGSAVCLSRRRNEHFSSFQLKKHSNKRLEGHSNKYGKEDLIFSIIEVCPKDTLIKREQYWIDKIGPEFNLNPIAGSQLGFKRSEKTKRLDRKRAKQRMKDPKLRQRLREAALKQFENPEQRKNLSDSAKSRSFGKDNPMYGKHHSKKAIALMKKRKKGKYLGKNNPNYGNHKLAGKNNPMYGRDFSGKNNPNYGHKWIYPYQIEFKKEIV
jgi:group I intron endonuclease